VEVIFHGFKSTCSRAQEPNETCAHSLPFAVEPCRAECGERHVANNRGSRHRSFLRIFARWNKTAFGIQVRRFAHLIIKTHSKNLCQVERVTTGFLRNLFFATEAIGYAWQKSTIEMSFSTKEVGGEIIIFLRALGQNSNFPKRHSMFFHCSK
jgi:hypothetical protein